MGDFASGGGPTLSGEGTGQELGDRVTFETVSGDDGHEVEFDLRVVVVGDTAVLQPKGPLDVSTTEEFRRAAHALVARGIATLTLDASRVEFVDSSAIGTLARLQRVVSERGGQVAVVRASAMFRKVAAITGLDGVLDFHGAPDEGRAPG